MSVSFVVLGVTVSAFGHLLGIDDTTIVKIAALVMIALGVVLLVPQFTARFATATAGMSAAADGQIGKLDNGGLRGPFLTGTLMGAVWSPCVGPTLGAAIALAAQGENLTRATVIMVAFALGISLVLLALAYGTRGAIQRRTDLFRRLSRYARPVMGITLVVVGLMMYSGLYRTIESALLDLMPVAWQDFTVIL